MLTVREVEHGDTFISLELTEHFAYQWLAVRPERLGGLQAHQARHRRDVGLPATPDNRIAMAHQKAIAWVKWGRWVNGAWDTVEVCHDRLAPTIHHIAQQTTVAALGVEWLQQCVGVQCTRAARQRPKRRQARPTGKNRTTMQSMSQSAWCVATSTTCMRVSLAWASPCTAGLEFLHVRHQTL